MKLSTIEELSRAVKFLQSVAIDVRTDTIEAVATNDPQTVLTHFDALRHVNAQIKEAREALSELEDTLSRTQIPDIMRNAGVKTITIIGVGRCTVSYKFSASMIDKEKGMQWLRENGLGELIQETVNSSTLAATAKNLIEVEGKELPDTLFKVGTNPYTSITKAK